MTEPAVFRRGLAVVVWLTEGLPVRLIPESFFVATVGDDVVDHGSRSDDTVSVAVHTEGMTPQIGEASALPLATVATFVCSTSAFGLLVLGCALVGWAATTVDQSRTTRVSTRALGGVWRSVKRLG